MNMKDSATFNQKLLNSQGNILLAIKLILNWQDLVSKRATVIINIMYTQHVINTVQVPLKIGRCIRETLYKNVSGLCTVCF